MTSAPPTSNKRLHRDESDENGQNKRAREYADGAPPAGPRSLRLRSSHDGDAASSQQLASGLVAPPNTQLPSALGGSEAASPSQFSDEAAASQEVSATAMVVAEPPAPVVVVVADPARAKELLRAAVAERRARAAQGAEAAAADASWVRGVWVALGVSGSLELEQLLERVCGALSAWLDELDARELVAAKQQLALDLLLQVASALPRADDAAELSRHVLAPQPSDELEQEAAVTVLRRSITHPDLAQNAHARSLAVERAIERLAGACATCLVRVEWFADARGARAAQQRAVREQLGELRARLARMADDCGAEVRAGEGAVAAARQTQERRCEHIYALVCAREAALLAAGCSPMRAKVLAYQHVADSDDVEVAALWLACSESGQAIEQCEKSLATSRLELEFAQSIAALFARVHDRREQFLQNALKRFEDARTTSDEQATAALLRLVPTLAVVLEHYYKFHTIRQARARTELDKHARELERHIDYYGDTAPINREQIEKRIREFVGVISRSTQVMLQIAEAQSRLWRGHKDALPPVVRSAVAAAFGRLWRQRSGPVRDAMQAFVTEFQVDGASGFANAVESPAPTPKPARRASVGASASASASGSASPARVDDASESPALPPRARAARHSLSPGALRSVTSGVVKTLVSSVQASPVRVANKTQEVGAFLRGDANESALFARVSGADAAARGSESPARSAPPAPIALFPEPSPSVPSSVTATTTSADDEADASAAGGARPHEYAVDAVVYTKFEVDKDAGVSQYVRGRVARLLEDGSYRVVYDNGDEFTVAHEYLLTEHMRKDMEQQERQLKNKAQAGDGASGGDDGGDAAAQDSGDGGSCAIL